jgi:hypothetical protein
LAGEFLELLLDQDETETIRLLEEQLKVDPDPTRRRGYVLALKTSLAPSAVIILLRALHHEHDPTVWQTILIVLGKMQPTRAVLENLVQSGADFSIRHEAAEMLLARAYRDGRAIPASTTETLISFLGASETVSYPTEQLLSAAGIAPKDALALGLMNAASAGHAHSLFSNTQPENTWQRMLYPAIAFPTWTYVDRVEMLTIQLRMTADDPNLQPVTVDFRPVETEVTLNVFVSSEEMKVAGAWQTITVGRAGHSTMATFEVIPQREGRAHVTVEFFKEGRRVGFLMVRTHVFASSESPDVGGSFPQVSEETERWLRQQVISLENPVQHMHEKPAGLTFLAHVETSPNPGDHVLWFDPSAAAPHGVLSQAAIDWRDANGLFELFREDMAELLETTARLEVRQARAPSAGRGKEPAEDPDYVEYVQNLNYMLEGLKSIGQQLADFVALEFKGRIAEAATGTPLHFSSDAKVAWVPWELVYDDERQAFWGELYPVTRLASPLSEAQGHRYDAPAHGAMEPVIINVAGDNVVRGKAADLVQLLQNAFKGLPAQGNVVMPFKHYTVPEFITAIRSGSVIHITCVGERDRRDVYYLRLGPDMVHRFKPYFVRRLAFDAQPLLFANTCSSTSAFLTLDGYSNFAWEIYKRGAGAFIGTLAPVPTPQAIAFAETVYENLFGEGQTIGEALWQAKRTFSRKEPRHPFYLVYCLYGDSTWRWPEDGAIA